MLVFPRKQATKHVTVLSLLKIGELHHHIFVDQIIWDSPIIIFFQIEDLDDPWCGTCFETQGVYPLQKQL